MYTVFLAGGIASGKSTVARELSLRGARRIDLDQLSRRVLVPGGACLREIVAAFGTDLVEGEMGELDRGLLARRAFSSSEAARRLESIELPHIRAELARELARDTHPCCCVVEVPLLDRMGDVRGLADEVVCVTCPLPLRRLRARGRGMDPGDFDARAARQPTDDWLRAHSDVEFANDGDEGELLDQVALWWDAHARRGWSCGAADAMGETHA